MNGIDTNIVALFWVVVSSELYRQPHNLYVFMRYGKWNTLPIDAAFVADIQRGPLPICGARGRRQQQQGAVVVKQR